MLDAVSGHTGAHGLPQVFPENRATEWQQASYTLGVAALLVTLANPLGLSHVPSACSAIAFSDILYIFAMVAFLQKLCISFACPCVLSRVYARDTFFKFTLYTSSPSFAFSRTFRIHCRFIARLACWLLLLRGQYVFLHVHLAF